MVTVVSIMLTYVLCSLPCFARRKGDEQPTSAAVRLPLVQRRTAHLLGKHLNTLNSVELKSSMPSRWLIPLWAKHGGDTPCAATQVPYLPVGLSVSPLQNKCICKKKAKVVLYNN